MPTELMKKKREIQIRKLFLLLNLNTINEVIKDHDESGGQNKKQENLTKFKPFFSF